MNNLKISLFLLGAFAFTFAGAKEENNLQTPSFNLEKYHLVLDAQNEQREELENAVEGKSKIKAALFSAIIPGAGEAYAESWWRAALFAGLEIAFWTGKIIYDGKGDDEDARMRSFGDNHWNENRYWTHVITKVDWTGQTPDDNGDGYVSDAFIQSNRDALRQAEKDARYTHELPTTKTQQYYEMVYKYLGQFGVGWDDVEDTFGSWDYYDGDGNYRNLTPMVKEYRDMRNLSNDHYATADLMVNLVLVNHLFSAIDAAFAVKQYNNALKFSLNAEQKYLGYERINMYGLTVTW
jgi:hypothetical protein